MFVKYMYVCIVWYRITERENSSYGFSFGFGIVIFFLNCGFYCKLCTGTLINYYLINFPSTVLKSFAPMDKISKCQVTDLNTESCLTAIVFLLVLIPRGFWFIGNAGFSIFFSIWFLFYWEFIGKIHRVRCNKIPLSSSAVLFLLNILSFLSFLYWKKLYWIRKFEFYV